MSRMSDSYEITEEYYDRLLIEMRNLDSCEPDTSFTLFGKKFDTPVMTAALCLLDELRESGTREMVKGIKEAGACMGFGFSKDEEYDVAVEEGLSPIRFIKPYEDRSRIFREIEYSAQHNGLAVGMDISHGVNKQGYYELDPNRLDMYREFKPITSAELKSFVEASPLPFIAKDVLSVTDALKCKEAGCKGIVVGHHHSIMDYAVSPLMILPEIRKAVGEDMLIFVDGIYYGSDAFKAIALGANAVMAGRALIGEGFFKDGAAYVTDKINGITRELAGFMAHTCCQTIQDIDASLIHLKY